jgi:hypothetical protein
VTISTRADRTYAKVRAEAFADQHDQIVRDLRRLADEVDRHRQGSTIRSNTPTADIAESVIHAISWAIPNMRLDTFVRTAAEVDSANARIEGVS